MKHTVLRKVGSLAAAVIAAYLFYRVYGIYVEYYGDPEYNALFDVTVLFGAMCYFLFDGAAIAYNKKKEAKKARAIQAAAAAKKQANKPTVSGTPVKQIPNQASKQRASTTASMPKTKAEPRKNSITLETIAGYEATKESMAFLVECLRNSQKLRAMGAELPTGVLLYGPPGTGKTLFAKAVAGSAGVPYYCVSAASFMEKFVGVGAQRVRELFESARDHQPCIVFIDEIDAIGKNRDSNTNDERQQTLNQMLTEMSAVASDHEAILVMAATNRIDDLDPALVRPGRFDRKISVPLPNQSDRLAIIKLHCKKKRLSSDVNLNDLSMLTEGMSGADIASLVNEAAIQAVYQNHESITQEDLDNAVFRVMTNGEKVEVADPEALRVIAYHESGHALITKLFSHDKIPQISVVGSTSGALGVTMHYSEKDNQLLSKKQLEAKIMTYYGGRAAEQCYFGNNSDITTGASDDLKQASRLIREYLTTYGMSNDCILNMEAFSGAPDPNLTQEAKALANSLYENTLHALLDHRNDLDRLAEELLRKKTLTGDEIDQILEERMD